MYKKKKRIRRNIRYALAHTHSFKCLVIRKANRSANRHGRDLLQVQFLPKSSELSSLAAGVSTQAYREAEGSACCPRPLCGAEQELLRLGRLPRRPLKAPHKDHCLLDVPPCRSLSLIWKLGFKRGIVSLCSSQSKFFCQCYVPTANFISCMLSIILLAMTPLKSSWCLVGNLFHASISLTSSASPTWVSIELLGKANTWTLCLSADVMKLNNMIGFQLSQFVQQIENMRKYMAELQIHILVFGHWIIVYILLHGR